MRKNLPILLTLASLAAPSAALGSAADQQYSDPFGGTPKVTHRHHKAAHHKKHHKKKHRAAHHSGRKH